MKNHISIQEKTQDKQMFCYDGRIDLGSLADELGKELGVKLKAENKDDTLEGGMVSQFVDSGHTLCGIEVTKPHTCVILFTYAETKTVDYGSRGKAKIRKKKMPKKTISKLHNIIQAKDFKLKEVK